MGVPSEPMPVESVGYYPVAPIPVACAGCPACEDTMPYRMVPHPRHCGYLAGVSRDT